MALKSKKIPQSRPPRATNLKKQFSDGARLNVKGSTRTSQQQSTEELLVTQYLQTFTAFPLPYHGVLTENDSLEQPSALESVPSTSSPVLVS